MKRIYGIVFRFNVIVFFLFLFIYTETGRAALVDNFDGTVSDTVTGLQWQQATMDLDHNGIADDMTWEDALAACENLTLGGYSDWRLPNIFELLSLVDYSRSNPAIDTTVFPDTVYGDVQSGWYRSSTTSKDFQTLNDFVEYTRGNFGGTSKLIGGSAINCTRCVRRGLSGQIDQTEEIPLNGPVQSDLPPVSIETNFGTLTPLPGATFNPAQDTFVISHGWNRGESTDTPGWEMDMGEDLQAKTGVAEGNVLLWNWMEKAKSNHLNLNIVQLLAGVPYNNVKRSGLNLSNALYDYLPHNYQGKIHMIGHSLGSGVIIFATKNLQYRAANLDYEVGHLTLLDSPWYIKPPGGLFLFRNKNNIFIDNYYTCLGKPYFSFIDANVLMGNIHGTPDEQCHGSAHAWYRSSITNFDRKWILGDPDEPSTEQHYGFYWHESSHQNNVYDEWLHVPGTSKWRIIPSNYIVKKVEGKVIDGINAMQELQQTTKNYLIEEAKESKKDIKLLAATTFNVFNDTLSYTVDQTGHALWDYIASTNNGRLRMVLNSEAVVSVPVNIPIDATSMQFSYKFLPGGDPANKIEAFIENYPLFVAVAGDHLDNEGNVSERSEWIDVSRLAGGQFTLSFRFSNPTDGPLGEIAIDDIIFAKISPASSGFPWAMFLPATTNAKYNK